MIALALIAIDTTIAAGTDGIAATRAGTSPVSTAATDASVSVDVDPYAAFIALMRDVARAEGRVSDLQKERDQALARLQAARRDTGNDGGALTVTDAAWNRQIDDRMEALSTRYAAKLAAAEARLSELQREAAALRAQLP